MRAQTFNETWIHRRQKMVFACSLDETSVFLVSPAIFFSNRAVSPQHRETSKILTKVKKVGRAKISGATKAKRGLLAHLTEGHQSQNKRKL